MSQPKSITRLVDRISRLKAANEETFFPFLKSKAKIESTGNGPWDARTWLVNDGSRTEATENDIQEVSAPWLTFVQDYQQGASLVTESDILDRIRRVYDCSNVIEIRTKFVQHGEALEQEARLHNANFCGNHLVCRVCASRREAILRRRFEKPILDAAAAYPHAYELTVTIRDGESLSERLNVLRASFRAFVRYGQRRKGKRSAGEWAKVRAGISSTEIKRGENSGEWHVHAHVVIFCDSPLDYQIYDREKRSVLEAKYGRGRVPAEELKSIELDHEVFDGREIAVSRLSRQWIRATGGQGVSIHPKPITGTPQEVFAKVKDHALKYNVKFNPQDRADIPEILRDTFNRRLISTYGDFRHVNTDGLVDDVSDPQGEEIWISRWQAGRGEYGEPAPSVRPISLEEADEIRKSYLGKQAEEIGAYRTRRRQELISAVSQGMLPSLGRALDQIKADFRSSLQALWKRYRSEIRRREDIRRPEPCDLPGYQYSLAL